MATEQTFIIVGAGLTGAKAAEALRAEGFDGRVVLIGDEPERPYERPPLSKDYLRGEADRPYVHDEGFYADNRIELWTETRAAAIDAGSGEVVLDDDRRLGYDRLLIATGAEPRRLSLPGAELDGVHYLRTLADSERIGARFEPGRHFVVVGAGWIGSEIAASARQKGCEVTMIESAELPLLRVLGAEVGRIYRDLHVANGVEFLPESGVERFDGDGSVERVVTGAGKAIEATDVVVGIGVAPRTGLAEAAGLRLDNGILVDESLETSVPGIFAAGDVANAFHPFYGRHIRVEHWANALNQGPAAAGAMLGEPVRYEEIPYFFSDQYDTGMEYSGFATEWDEVVFRGDVDGRELIAFWLKDERLVAGMNLNVWDVNDAIRGLIRSRRTLAAGDLSDPGIALEELAGSGVGAAGATDGG
ncbi:MAG: FAD-dependent oxidoreductase [Solirubrobacterales bacterium]